MKGPGIKDYLEVIQVMKLEAQEQKQQFIEINSKKLHEEVSKEHATMPTCCQAMYKLMLEGDEILQRPKGATGYGSHLTIRFYVDVLEGRAQMYPNKKRGRPRKSEEEKLAAKKAKMKHNSEDLNKLVKAFLKDQGWEYFDHDECIEAHHDQKKWLINIQGIKRGRKQSLPMKLSEIMKHMEDEDTHYSMAVNDSITYRRQWKEIPDVVKQRLHMSVLFADKKGNIIEM